MLMRNELFLKEKEKLDKAAGRSDFEELRSRIRTSYPMIPIYAFLGFCPELDLDC